MYDHGSELSSSMESDDQEIKGRRAVSAPGPRLRKNASSGKGESPSVCCRLFVCFVCAAWLSPLDRTVRERERERKL